VRGRTARVLTTFSLVCNTVRMAGSVMVGGKYFGRVSVGSITSFRLPITVPIHSVSLGLSSAATEMDLLVQTDSLPTNSSYLLKASSTSGTLDATFRVEDTVVHPHVGGVYYVGVQAPGASATQEFTLSIN